jgi:hypothetical protein
MARLRAGIGGKGSRMLDLAMMARVAGGGGKRETEIGDREELVGYPFGLNNDERRKRQAGTVTSPLTWRVSERQARGCSR